MALSSDDYNCVRCQGAFKWEELQQTPAGNLFCASCWHALNDEATRRCPVDDAEMEKKRIMDVWVIDRCPRCDGVWFDKGDLHALEQAAKKEGMAEGFLLGFIL